MAATLTRLIFFASGDLHAIVKADFDSELAAHKGPLNSVFADVPRKSYEVARALRDQMALGLPVVAAKDVVVASAISAKIQAIDDAAALQAAADAALVDSPDILP
jgi:hypothetical protein